MDNPAFVHPRPTGSTPEGGDTPDEEDLSSSTGVSDGASKDEKGGTVAIPGSSSSTTSIQRAVEACQRGDEEALEKCIEEGILGTALDGDGCSLLHWAAINNHCTIIRKLLSLGADPNYLGGILISSPLHWAARVGNLNACAELVKAGSRCDIKDTQGYTPMHLAVQSCHGPVVAYFIRHYHYAIDVTDNSGMTPVMWCAFRVFEMFPLRLLVRAGADLTVRERLQGNTALHLAAQERNYSAVKELLSGGADCMATNAQQETPLDIARNTRNIRIVSILEKAGRQSGQIRSNCINKIRDSDAIARVAQFFGPGLFLAMAAILFHTVHPIIALVVLILIAIPVRLKIDTHQIQHSLLPIGITVAEAATMAGTWSFSVHWWVPWWAQLAFVLFMATLLLCLIRCALCDAGTITPSKSPYDDFSKIVDEKRLSYFCYSCFVNRPPGAKHCSVCDKCVVNFDHHCPWLNACITRKNHREFLLFVLSVGMTSAIFDAAVIAFTVRRLRVDDFGTFMYNHSWLVFTGILAVLHVLLMSSLFCVQTMQIAQGVTTNQRLKGHGHGHYPRHTRIRDEEEGDSSPNHSDSHSSGLIFYIRNCLNFCAGN